MRSKFSPAPEFSPPGMYEKGLNGTWSFIPDPLPPLLDLNSLHSQLRCVRREVAKLRRRIKYLPFDSILNNCLTENSVENFVHTPASFGKLKFPSGVSAFTTMSLDNIYRASEDIMKISRRRGHFICYLRKIHEVVAHYSSVNARPGAMRRSSVVIAPGEGGYGIHHLAPRHTAIVSLLRDLERFVNDSTMDFIVQAVLSSYQIIVIQPFPDGNSRVAIFLLEALLRESGFIGEYVLPIRSVIENSQQELSEKFLEVLRWGAWRNYLSLMLSILCETCRYAYRRTYS